MTQTNIVLADRITSAILVLRGEKVMLDVTPPLLASLESHHGHPAMARGKRVRYSTEATG